MKESTKKLINEQIKKVLSELEQVEDVADRVELRIEAIEMIYKVSGDANIENIIPQGKDSIKEDKAKNPVVVEEEEEEVPEIPEEMVNEVEPEPELPEVEELEEVSMDDILNAGDNLNPEVAAQAANAVQGEELNNLEEEPEELTVEVPEELSKEFELLSNINDVNNEIIEHKIFVANWIHEDDLETVELYINYFASNIEEDENGDAMYIGEELHLDFLNENNIAGFIDYINVLSE
jgi:hypothetical protein